HCALAEEPPEKRQEEGAPDNDAHRRQEPREGAVVLPRAAGAKGQGDGGVERGWPAEGGRGLGPQFDLPRLDGPGALVAEGIHHRRVSRHPPLGGASRAQDDLDGGFTFRAFGRRGREEGGERLPFGGGPPTRLTGADLRCHWRPLALAV